MKVSLDCKCTSIPDRLCVKSFRNRRDGNDDDEENVTLTYKERKTNNKYLISR